MTRINESLGRLESLFARSAMIGESFPHGGNAKPAGDIEPVGLVNGVGVMLEAWMRRTKPIFWKNIA
jgi:hypothetical protein